MANLLLITKSNKKNVILEKILYIYYLFYFQKDTIKVKIIINSNNKINIIILVYIAKLGFKTYYNNIKA